MHSNFSNLLYFTNCWADVEKNSSAKDRDLHYDQNMEKFLRVSIKYPKLGVLVPSFSQTGNEIKKKLGWK